MNKNKLKVAILASLVAMSGGLVAQERTMQQEGHMNERTTTMERDRNFREAVGDTTTATQINAKYATSSTVDALDINVDVRDGTVFLRGHVANAGERDEAVRLAEEIDGVTRVDTSDLIIDPEH